MQSFLFNILKYSLYLWALLPLRVLYVLSDLLYFPLYYVMGYRKKVVRRNLKNSFPEKSEKERRTIEKQFYHHFCDYVVETIKLMHISDREMKRRFRFTNSEVIHELASDGKSIFLMMGHYCNWEWVPSITRWVPDQLLMAQIYRPLSNKAADKFFLKLRSRFGSVGIAKNDTLRDIIRYRKAGKQMMIGFIADQTPSKNNLHYWTTFLNQDTPCLTGAEKIARKIDAHVYFLDVQKVKRGYYEATFREIAVNSPETAEFEITEKYMRMMEETILRAPQYWLWTHKRWKHNRTTQN
ncbi:MAG: lysophospholipid acyltransferase family protein [Bacteroidales bacterium]